MYIDMQVNLANVDCLDHKTGDLICKGQASSVLLKTNMWL